MKDDSQSLAAEAFGRNLRKLRTDRKMTQEKLAEELGISTKHVGDLESGKSFTTGQMMDSIAAFFDVGFDELFLSEGREKDLETEAARMASRMLRKNTEDFEKKYGVEIKIKD